LIEGYRAGGKGQKELPLRGLLTQREREVLKLIADGYTNQEIADTLYISVHTVESHRNHLMGKLDVHNTAALIARAIEKGLVSKNKDVSRRHSFPRFPQYFDRGISKG
jgi:DNA-binding CsgD family transcriptional regulator